MKYTLKDLQESILVATCSSMENAMVAIKSYLYFPKDSEMWTTKVQDRLEVHTVETEAKRLSMVVARTGGRFRVYHMPKGWEPMLLPIGSRHANNNKLT